MKATEQNFLAVQFIMTCKATLDRVLTDSSNFSWTILSEGKGVMTLTLLRSIDKARPQHQELSPCPTQVCGPANDVTLEGQEAGPAT